MMRNKITFLLSFCILMAAPAFAQQKTTARPKTKAKPKTKTVAKTPAPAPVKEVACYPLREVRDYYKIDLKDKKFKSDYEEIFELSRYMYTGYSLKSIIENTVRKKAGESVANSLDLFAGASYLEIGVSKPEYKKQVMDIVCELFADADAFEKYIETLK